MTYVPNALLSRLVGTRLESITFLKWYCQLNFDGAQLNCDVWPKVVREGVESVVGEPGYRDALCSFLAMDVIATAEGTGVGLLLEFESGAIRIHPSVDDLEGPEIALLGGFTDGAWMCWRPGEESFEDLA